MAFSNPATEIESLFVRIFADASGYFRTLRMVRDQNISIRSTFLSLGETAAAASKNLAKVTASVVGLSVAFGRFDDVLTRTMTHMRDWNSTNRALFERAIFNVSGNSRTGPFEVARGLEVLSMSGMNAAMQARALGIAETFAVAANMDMVSATRHLVDTQRVLGLSSDDVETHFRNMTHMADTFVGLAPLVGSTTEEFTTAFGPRLTSMMRMLNMSFEEGAKLIAIYSLNNIRGHEASDRAAMGLQGLSRYSLENWYRWKALGVEIWNVQGGLKPLDEIIGSLSGQLGHLTPMQQAATLALLGFERRTIAAIMPLIGMTEASKLLGEELKKVGGMSALTAEMMRRDFIGQLKQAWNNITAVAIVLGVHLAPIVVFFAQQIKDLAQWFIALHPAVRSFVIISSLIAVGLMPLIRFIQAMVGFLNPLKMVIGLFGALKEILLFLVSPLTLIGSLIYRVFAVSFSAIGAILGGVWSLVSTIVPALFSIFGVVGGIIANFVFWSLALSTALTLLLSIGAAMSAIGASISAIFAGFIQLVIGFGRTIERNWEEIRAAGVDTFMGVGDAAKKFFRGMGDFVQNAAGFFWNFRENMSTVLKYISENWEGMLTDLENATRVFFRNLGADLGPVWEFLVTTFKEAFGLIWGYIDNFLSSIVYYFHFNWSSITGNLSEIFNTFFRNLLHNWGITVKAMIDVLLGSIGASPVKGLLGRIGGHLALGMGWTTRRDFDAAMRQIDQEGTRTPSSIMTDAWREMRSLNHGMGNLRTLTPFRETTAVGVASRFVPSSPVLSDVWSNITRAFDKMNTNLVPLFQGFASVLPGIHLNLATPPNIMGDLIQRFTRFMRPYHDVSDTAPGMQYGGGGPGFTFKQLSLARYQVGGEALTKLDYQQLITLRQIANHTMILAHVANAWLTGGGQRRGVQIGVNPLPIGPVFFPLPVLGP